MARYEIPLHGFEEDEPTGVHVIIEGNRVSLVDYSTDTPHDLVSMQRSDVVRLVKLLTTWLASETKVHGLFSDEYGEYKDE